MISTSSEFKNAIKKDERRIKGYVDVIYKLESPTVTTTSNYTSQIKTPFSSMTTGARVKQQYGTLDYLPLDGSYMTCGTSQITDGGFISDKVVSKNQMVHIYGFDFTFTFSSITIPAITVYTRNNPIKQATIEIFNGSTSLGTYTFTSNNYEDILTFDFNGNKTITKAYLNIESENAFDEYRKVRIEKVDLGLTYSYKDNNLISFTVDEEVNKLAEELPINEVDVTINNENDLFNPLNPKGIVKYLNSNVKITPYIGVLTENNGVEYVKMGEYFYNDYQNNDDKTTTLNAKNLFNVISSGEIVKGLANTTNVFIDQSSSASNNKTEAILSTSGYTANINTSTRYSYYLSQYRNLNIMDYLKEIAMHNFAIVYADRNNIIQIKNINNTVQKNITREELITDANYKVVDRINTINKKRNIITCDATTSSSETKIFEQTITLTSSTQYVVINKAYAVLLSNGYITTTITGASSYTLEFENTLMCIYKVNGTVGNTVSFKATSSYVLTTGNRETITTVTNKSSSENEVLLEITSDLNGFSSSYVNALGQLNYTPSYKASLNYFGDPSLEAGDYINVETPYGYKKLFIQKNTFTYDGGLTGYIEGVE